MGAERSTPKMADVRQQRANGGPASHGMGCLQSEWLSFVGFLYWRLCLEGDLVVFRPKLCFAILALHCIIMKCLRDCGSEMRVHLISHFS